jgi:hypothetical protein
MKKLGLIAAITACLVLVLLAGTAIWFKGHKEEIARSLTGKNIRFTDLAIQYSPMPSIVLTDLTWEEGRYACRIPKLSLYPDFSEILRGRIQLKKTILEEPLFVAQGIDGWPSNRSGNHTPSRPFYTMDAFPGGLVRVNEGKIVLQPTKETSLPVYVSAQAEKTNHHFSIFLNQASIEEFGLQFAGTLGISSLDPLKLHVEAEQGTFNPSAAKNFLFKFGFWDEEKASWIPPISRIETKALTLDYDAESGQLHLKSPALSMDQTQFKDIDLSLTRNGSFSIQWADASVEAKNVYNWLHQNPKGNQLLANFLTRIKLSALSPEGTVRISSLDVSGEMKADTGIDAQTLKGETGIEVKGLRLGIEDQNGHQGQVTIDAIEATIRFDQGQAAVEVDEMTFHSPEGGTGRITGVFPLPLNVKKTTLTSAIDDFTLFESTVDFHLSKGKHPKARFDLSIVSPFVELSTDGLFYLPGRNETDVELRIGHLRITDSPAKTKVKPEEPLEIIDRPFATHWMPETDFSVSVWANKLQWDTYSPFRNVSMRLEAKGNTAILTGDARICGVNCSTSAYLMAPSRLVTTLETRGTDVNLTSLVACFSKELPVFLEGRLYVTGDFSAYGDNPREWIDGAEGDMMITVNRAAVHRISALDPRLGFFLDIFNTAGIHSGPQDSIRLNKGTVRANLRKGSLFLDRFSLAGPMLNAWGKGEFRIDERRLRLTGGVTTQWGVSKGLNVDRYLIKEGNTG